MSDAASPNGAPPPGGPRTLGGQAADTALPAGWGQPQDKKKVGRIGDFQGQSGQGSRGPGQGMPNAFDEADDAKKGEELYAGGERSGLAVQTPDQAGGSRGPRGIVNNILRQAAENSPGQDPQNAKVQAPKSSFGGTGNVLGDDETPSAPAAAPGTATAQPAPSGLPQGPGASGGRGGANAGPSSLLQSLLSGFRGAGEQDEEDEDDEENVVRHLIFWRDGFSIEDGPLMRYDEPGNKDVLEAIQAGRAPRSLFDVKFNQPLRLEVSQRTTEAYVAPPKVLKPFEGGGNRLGSITPDIGGSGSSGSGGGVLQGGSSASGAPATNAPSSAPQFQVDTTKLTTSIQLRLGDGTKLVAKVNLTHTVGDLRNFVSAARPDNRPFVLQTTFPNKELSDSSQTVEDAKLQNAVVVQRFT